MEFRRLSIWVNLYILLILNQVIIVSGDHERNNNKIQDTSYKKMDTYQQKPLAYELFSDIHNDFTSQTGYAVRSSNNRTMTYSDNCCQKTSRGFRFVLVPRGTLGKSCTMKRNVWPRYISFPSSGEIYFEFNGYRTVEKMPLVISSGCFSYTSETKSGRGELYVDMIRCMANAKLSKTRCAIVFPRVTTNEFRCGTKQCPTFRFVVMSEEIFKFYSRHIAHNVKNEKDSATYTKDNFKNVFTVCFILYLLFRFCAFDAEIFLDKDGRNRPVNFIDIGDQNSNSKKEKEQTRDTLPKEGMIDTTAQDAGQTITDSAITGGAREDSLVKEHGNAEYKSSISIHGNKANETDREHGARIGTSSDVSNIIRTHGQKTVRQSSILNEGHVATNVNTPPDDEEKTNDAIDTVETVNVGTGRDVSEYLTPETDQLEVLEATKEAVGQPSIPNEERVATNGNTVNDDEVKTNDAINAVETFNVRIERIVSEYLTSKTTHLEVLEATKEAVGQPSIPNEERVATNGNTVNDDEVKTNDAIDTGETFNVGTGRDVSEYLTPETDQLEVLEATKEGGAAQEDELVCKICYMEEISVVFLPCSHMLACESCSKLLERCAVCRAVIKAMLKAEIK